MSRGTSLELPSREGFTLARFRGARKQHYVDRLNSHSNVWIHGAQATGKTHLAYAVAHSVQNSLLIADTEYELDGCDVFELLVFDDFDAWLGSRDREIQLYSVYEKLAAKGGRLIVTALRPPQDIEFVLPDLATRTRTFARIELGYLSDTEKVALLQERAADRGFELPDNVTQFLIARLDRSHQSLFEALDQLDRESMINQRKITIPFVKSVLKL